MPKPHPKTGEKRKTRQPFKIDQLPKSVHDAILDARAKEGLTWEQISEKSHEFVDWSSLTPEVLEEFPNLRLPASSLHRWYNVRVEQVQQETLREAAVYEQFAAKMAAHTVDGADLAVINAFRNEVFALARSAAISDRVLFINGLNQLTLAMTRLQRVDLMKRKVAVDEKKVEQLVKDAELRRQRAEAETQTAAKKLQNGQLRLSDINRLRQRAFGLPPLDAEGNVAHVEAGKVDAA